MFLNTSYTDFQRLPSASVLNIALQLSPDSLESEPLPEPDSSAPLTPPAWSTTPATLSYDATPEPDHEHADRSAIWALLPLPLSARDIYLWEYFDRRVTPQCTLNAEINPYRDILLRVAASSPGGPLMQCILAVSANELHNLGHDAYRTSIWDHRAHALRLLRREVELDSTATDLSLSRITDTAQILLSTMMLCFFEVNSLFTSSPRYRRSSVNTPC